MKKKNCLIIDELNRVSPEVLKAVKLMCKSKAIKKYAKKNKLKIKKLKISKVKAADMLWLPKKEY